jgi:hypothetical protein
MKLRTTITLIALGFLVFGAPALRCSETKAEEMINRAYSVFMTPEASTETIMKALTEILDAAFLILPKTDYTEEYKSRIEVAKKMFAERSLFNEKSHQYLGLAYRLVSGGKVWQVPEELTSVYHEKDIMAQAKKICQKLIDSALAELKAGRNERSVRYLLEFVLMVITPIQA